MSLVLTVVLQNLLGGRADFHSLSPRNTGSKAREEMPLTVSILYS